jgi:hypothetical protein
MPTRLWLFVYDDICDGGCGSSFSGSFPLDWTPGGAFDLDGNPADGWIWTGTIDGDGMGDGFGPYTPFTWSFLCDPLGIWDLTATARFGIGSPPPVSTIWLGNLIARNSTSSPFLQSFEAWNTPATCANCLVAVVIAPGV